MTSPLRLLRLRARRRGADDAAANAGGRAGTPLHCRSQPMKNIYLCKPGYTKWKTVTGATGTSIRRHTARAESQRRSSGSGRRQARAPARCTHRHVRLHTRDAGRPDNNHISRRTVRQDQQADHKLHHMSQGTAHKVGSERGEHRGRDHLLTLAPRQRHRHQERHLHLLGRQVLAGVEQPERVQQDDQELHQRQGHRQVQRVDTAPGQDGEPGYSSAQPRCSTPSVHRRGRSTPQPTVAPHHQPDRGQRAERVVLPHPGAHQTMRHRRRRGAGCSLRVQRRRHTPPGLLDGQDDDRVRQQHNPHNSTPKVTMQGAKSALCHGDDSAAILASGLRSAEQRHHHAGRHGGGSVAGTFGTFKFGSKATGNNTGRQGRCDLPGVLRDRTSPTWGTAKAWTPSAYVPRHSSTPRSIINNAVTQDRGSGTEGVPDPRSAV